jgi:CYTH domain-containing protein
MGKEIERKFLVSGEFRHLAVSSTRVVQTYLSVDACRTIRIRIAGGKAFLTVKSMPGRDSISRLEWEIPVEMDDALGMMKICLPGKIEKTRYVVPHGSRYFEVDVFHDRNDGLIIAEIELESENELFEKPDWLGEEVTGRPEYFNSNLIK